MTWLPALSFRRALLSKAAVRRMSAAGPDRFVATTVSRPPDAAEGSGIGTKQNCRDSRFLHSAWFCVELSTLSTLPSTLRTSRAMSAFAGATALTYRMYSPRGAVTRKPLDEWPSPNTTFALCRRSDVPLSPLATLSLWETLDVLLPDFTWWLVLPHALIVSASRHQHVAIEALTGLPIHFAVYRYGH